jgi:hypothetical protein
MIRRAAHVRWFRFRRNHTPRQTEQPPEDTASDVANAFAYEKLDPERHRRPENIETQPDPRHRSFIYCRLSMRLYEVQRECHHDGGL